jgi:hypothetical protein
MGPKLTYNCNIFEPTFPAEFVSTETLALVERLAPRVGVIFWFSSHTMQCQPEGLGYIFIAGQGSQAYAEMLV